MYVPITRLLSTSVLKILGGTRHALPFTPLFFTTAVRPFHRSNQTAELQSTFRKCRHCTVSTYCTIINPKESDTSNKEVQTAGYAGETYQLHAVMSGNAHAGVITAIRAKHASALSLYTCLPTEEGHKYIFQVLKYLVR